MRAFVTDKLKRTLRTISWTTTRAKWEGVEYGM